VKLRFLDGFRTDYDSLREELQAKVDKALALLLANPRHPSLCVKKMQGRLGIWEARVDRQHRMTFRIEGDLYVMRGVGKHDETLSKP
jgi:hypothetical protein